MSRRRTPRPRTRPRPWHARAPLRSARRRRAAGPPPVHPSGFTLIELLIVLAVVSIVMTMGVPPLLDTYSQMRVNLAAAEAAGEIRLARMTAVRSRTHVALRFQVVEGTVHTAVYGDGDGDGVRARDIEAGVDRQLRRPVPLRRIGASARLGFPPGPAPRDPGSPRRRLDRLDDPIRFNRSDMVSFSPIGASTPGSLYFTDGKSRLAVVRVYGRTGKVKVLVYDRRTEEWK